MADYGEKGARVLGKEGELEKAIELYVIIADYLHSLLFLDMAKKAYASLGRLFPRPKPACTISQCCPSLPVFSMYCIGTPKHCFVFRQDHINTVVLIIAPPNFSPLFFVMLPRRLLDHLGCLPFRSALEKL